MANSPEDQLLIASRARALHNAMAELIQLRQHDFMQRLIADYRADRLEEKHIWAAIGVFSEHKHILDSINREVKAGIVEVNVNE